MWSARASDSYKPFTSAKKRTRSVQKPNRCRNGAARTPENSASERLDAVPSLSHPLQFVLVALAGWCNQQQRDVIDYLLEENRVLRDQIAAGPALHRRPAPSTRREGPDAGPTGVARLRHDRDAGHAAGVASDPHRGAVRRQCPAWSRAAPVMSEIRAR